MTWSYVFALYSLTDSLHRQLIALPSLTPSSTHSHSHLVIILLLLLLLFFFFLKLKKSLHREHNMVGECTAKGRLIWVYCVEMYCVLCIVYCVLCTCIIVERRSTHPQGLPVCPKGEDRFPRHMSGTSLCQKQVPDKLPPSSSYARWPPRRPCRHKLDLAMLHNDSTLPRTHF